MSVTNGLDLKKLILTIDDPLYVQFRYVYIKKIEDDLGSTNNSIEYVQKLEKIVHSDSKSMHELLSLFIGTMKSNMLFTIDQYIKMLEYILNINTKNLNSNTTNMSEIAKKFFAKVKMEEKDDNAYEGILNTILTSKVPYADIPPVVSMCFNVIIPFLVTTIAVDRNKLDTYMSIVYKYDSESITSEIMPIFINILTDNLKLLNDENKKRILAHTHSLLASYIPDIKNPKIKETYQQLLSGMKNGGMRSRKRLMTRRITKTKGTRRRRGKSTKRGRRRRSV